MSLITFGLNTGNTVQATADTCLVQGYPNTVQGAGNRFYVSNVSGSQNKSLVFFSGIKAALDAIGPLTINSVTLRLRRLNNVTAPSRNIEVRRLLVTFTEAQATWNNRATATPWGAAGAIGAGDVESTPIGTAVMPSTGGAYFSVTGAAMKAWVEGILAGTFTDYGVIISLENPTTVGSGDFDIASKEATDGQRPYLEIDYTVVAPPSLTISDVTVNNHSGTATVVVSLSAGAPPGGVTVNYATQDDTATAPAYYTAATGTLTFAEGESTKNVTVSIVP